MVTDDKSRQQSAYIPQSGTQQGSGQATTQPQRYEGRWPTPRRATAVDPMITPVRRLAVPAHASLE